MKRIISILMTIFALLTLVLPASAASSSSQFHPYFNILDVLKDQTVTIQVFNFPSKDNFRVTMGAYGSYGIGGVVVGFTDSGNGGSFDATYSIPSTLAGFERIAIRLQSPTTGYFAYNWFFNTSASETPTQQPTPTATPTPIGYSGFPTFLISAVVKDQTVTISGKNFPSNDNFSVLMGKYGSRGIGGINVGGTNSGTGGVLSETYNIPSSLAGETKIAIRLQSPTSGYYAYNWFWNNSTP